LRWRISGQRIEEQATEEELIVEAKEELVVVAQEVGARDEEGENKRTKQYAS